MLALLSAPWLDGLAWSAALSCTLASGEPPGSRQRAQQGLLRVERERLADLVTKSPNFRGLRFALSTPCGSGPDHDHAGVGLPLNLGWRRLRPCHHVMMEHGSGGRMRVDRIHVRGPGRVESRSVCHQNTLRAWGEQSELSPAMQPRPSAEHKVWPLLRVSGGSPSGPDPFSPADRLKGRRWSSRTERSRGEPRACSGDMWAAVPRTVPTSVSVAAAKVATPPCYR